MCSPSTTAFTVSTSPPNPALISHQVQVQAAQLAEHRPQEQARRGGAGELCGDVARHAPPREVVAQGEGDADGLDTA